MGQECARKIAERMNDVKKSSKASVSDAKPAAALMPAASAREEHPTSVLDSSLRTKGPGSSSEKATCPISPGIEDLHIAESSNNPGTRYEGDRDPDREIAVATDDANEEGKTPAAYDNDYGFGHSAGSVGETFESGSSTTTHNIPIKGILAESSPCLLRGSLKIGTAVRVPGDGSFQNFLAESHCSLGTQEIESGNETTDDEIVQSSEDSTIISTVQRPAKNRNLDEVYEDATACADRANARAKFLYDFLCSLMANAGIAWCLWYVTVRTLVTFTCS